MHFWWPNKALWELDQIRPILVFHLGIFGEQKPEEERRREEEEKKNKKDEDERYGTRILYGNHVFVWILVWNLYGNAMILYGSVCMEISGSISRVWIRIHPNPRCLQSWVGKTLVCIR